MAAIVTIDGIDGFGAGRRGRGSEDGCKRVRRKDGRSILLCPVPKSKRHPSGWTFVKGTTR